MSAEAARAPLSQEASPAGVSPPSLSGAGRRFLSDILVELGFVEEAAAAQAVDAARRPGMTRRRRSSWRRAPSARTSSHVRSPSATQSLTSTSTSTPSTRPPPASCADRCSPLPRHDRLHGRGPLIVAIADPTDSLGLQRHRRDDEAGRTARRRPGTQIARLLEELNFMDEPEPAPTRSQGR